MKIRLFGNSVRVRLTQTEVARLGTGERIEQTTPFSSDSKLVSSLEPSRQVTTLTVCFSDLHLAILLPAEQVTQWAKSDQVGLEAQQSIAEDQSLLILVEKDFECLHGEAAESVDAYPNPRAT